LDPLALPRRICEWGHRAWREPLTVFLTLGLLLYAAHYLVANGQEDKTARQIVVDRQALLGYMQARTGDYGTRPEARLDAMSDAELAALADTYAREEAMYREALSLGLDQNDYLVRQRLVQSLRFLFRSLGESGEPSQYKLQDFYEAHQSRYTAPSTITFTHIFFDEAQRGRTQAQELARATRAKLNARRLALSDGAPWPGDRFTYNLNYADRDESLIASHFGKDMARLLFSTKADGQVWQGPFHSERGVHIVRIDRLSRGRILPFAQVRDEVARDYRDMQGQQLERSAVDGLVKDYDISFSTELRRMMHDGPPHQ
jgi:peptidyl-prolyl cis-trans isomerase C